MNKKTFRSSFIYSLSLFAVLFSGVCSLSLGTQSQISNIQDDVVDYVFESKDSFQFTIFRDKKRVESFIGNDILSSLRSNFYSFATASRLFDDNFYFEIEYEDKIIHQDVALLESIEKPYDSSNFLIQGDLPILCSEPIRTNNYSTNYGYLSTNADSIYIPDSLANHLLDYFGIEKPEQMVYFENANMGAQSLLNVKLKTTLDDSLEYNLKLRGIYKEENKLGNKLMLIGGKENSTIICSPGLFDLINFCPNKMYCMIKFNSNSNETYNRFFSVLENGFGGIHNSFNFSYNQNLDINEFFTSKIRIFESAFYNRYQLVFILASIALFIFSLFFSFLYLRKKKLNTVVSIAIFVPLYLFAIVIFSKINTPLLTMLTNKSLYFSIPIFVLHFAILFFLFIRNKNNKSKKSFKCTTDMLDYLKIDI